MYIPDIFMMMPSLPLNIRYHYGSRQNNKLATVSFEVFQGTFLYTYNTLCSNYNYSEKEDEIILPRSQFTVIGIIL